MTDTPAHTPLRLDILTGRDAAGLAWGQFIVRACNSHYLLTEALREAIDAIEDDRGLDDYICCSGYMCGCQGSSKRQLMLHDLRAALSQAGGASE